MDANSLWSKMKQDLKGEFPPTFFDVYFEEKETKPVAIKNNIFYLKGNNRSKEFFETQKRDLILKTLEQYNVTNIVVLTNDLDDKEIYKSLQEEKNSTSDSDDKSDWNKLISKANNIAHANLNPKYTFNTFVEGPSNALAVAACKRVSDSDETLNDNPLFIYGGVGLGKTHLMHGIGHRFLERDPSKKILYVSSETFTNDLISAIREKKSDEFREKYRSVDIFMIDDVQFIAGKTSVEEELFHTFNDVHAAGKKIILSSDRPPKDIPKLEERLQSRFKWGMTVDIQAPDYSTRMAILQTKAENDDISLPNDVTEYIADNVQSNIRELEGALNKVILYADLSTKELNLTTAKEALKDILVSYNTKEVNILRIKEMVANAYNVTIEELDSKKRTKNIAFPRQVAMYIARNILDLSLPSIGNEFGGRDHTTVMHAVRKIEDEINKSEMTRVQIEKIISDLNS